MLLVLYINLILFDDFISRWNWIWQLPFNNIKFPSNFRQFYKMLICRRWICNFADWIFYVKMQKQVHQEKSMFQLVFYMWIWEIIKNVKENVIILTEITPCLVPFRYRFIFPRLKDFSCSLKNLLSILDKLFMQLTQIIWICN